MATEAGEAKQVTSELRLKIEKIARDEGFVKPLLEFKKGSNDGDGFVGFFLRVTITEQDGNSQKSVMSLIVKSPPSTDAFMNQVFRVDLTILMELVFYRQIKPAFMKFQRERGIAESDFAPTSPHCFDATSDIILEDMTPLGYRLVPRNSQMLDFAHCSEFVKELGRMHAVSFAIKDQQPELFKELTKDLQEPFVRTDPSEVMMERFDRAMLMAVEELKKRDALVDKERYVKAMEGFNVDYYKKVTDCLEVNRSDPYTVLSHGDCWSNNALFKYDGKDKSLPTGACLIDFQVIRSSSPAIDLTYVIFICTTKAVRDKHYKDILEAYYDSLTTFLRKLGSDPEKLFPHSIFESHLKKFSKFSLALTIHEVPAFTYNADDEPADGGEGAFALSHANHEPCWSHICDVIVDMVDLGYVE